jgi:predicted enzyme related to lactoylglutathione lyase
MSRPIHFEIQADDLERAKTFYSEVFGWTFEDYRGVVTGAEDSPGINGGMLQRAVPTPGVDQGSNAAVLTMGVESFDVTSEQILVAGGLVATPKMALMGMAWQGYFLDTEGNTFGIHQPDENAA